MNCSLASFRLLAGDLALQPRQLVAETPALLRQVDEVPQRHGDGGPVREDGVARRRALGLGGRDQGGDPGQPADGGRVVREGRLDRRRCPGDRRPHRLSRGDAVLGPDRADGADDVLHGAEAGQRVGVGGAGVGPRPGRHRDRRVGLAAGQALPQRLGDERHRRVQQPERDVEGLRQDGARHVAAGLVPVEAGLDLLDVPVGQVVPEEAVGGAHGVVEAEALERLGRLPDGEVAAGDDPPVGELQLLAPHARPARAPASGRVGPSRLVRMNRPAFQSLLAKLRPAAKELSRSSGSRMTSVPTAAPERAV